MAHSTTPLSELRKTWQVYWKHPPHQQIGRAMLEASIEFKRWEHETGGIPTHIKHKLKSLLQNQDAHRYSHGAKKLLKPGARLERVYKGKKHNVLVTENGFEYNAQNWSSLSKIANHITGSKWNGWIFFGLKQK